MNHPLTILALANPFTARSFATLDKHSATGPIDPNRALRLLRRNVRDVAPCSSYATQQRIARELLQHWRTHGSVQHTVTDSE